MKSIIKNEINHQIVELQDRRGLLINQLEKLELVTVMNDYRKNILKKTNVELEEVAKEIKKLLTMKDEGIVQDLLEQIELFNKENSTNLSIEEAIHANLDNMII